MTWAARRETNAGIPDTEQNSWCKGQCNLSHEMHMQPRVTHASVWGHLEDDTGSVTEAVHSIRDDKTSARTHA